MNTFEWICFDDRQSSGIWKFLTNSSYLQDDLSLLWDNLFAHSSADIRLLLCWRTLCSTNSQQYNLGKLLNMSENSLFSTILEFQKKYRGLMHTIVGPKIPPSIMNSHVSNWKENALFQSHSMTIVFTMYQTYFWIFSSFTRWKLTFYFLLRCDCYVSTNVLYNV